MQRLAFILSLSLCFFAGVVAFADGPPQYVSPGIMVMSPAQDLIYIGAQTANKVLVFDLAGKVVAREIPVSAAPTGLALSSDGALLIATLAGAPGKVVFLTAGDGGVLKEIPAGHTPMAPVCTADGKTLFICNRFDGTVARIDVETGATAATIAVGREPVAAALSSDGALLLVVHQLPGGPADGAYSAATVGIVDTAANALVKTLQLPNGSSSLREIAISPDGRFAYVTHVLSRYQLPTTQLERGWMNTNAFTVIDV
ncbi:MAG: hypothetical protein IT368_14775, partial [Candidatus Hydrogenedentes bacterium]|nr:hypothetical protein [Candidatus Hydrogenedentota bacterium]